MPNFSRQGRTRLVRSVKRTEAATQGSAFGSRPAPNTRIIPGGLAKLTSAIRKPVWNGTELESFGGTALLLESTSAGRDRVTNLAIELWYKTPGGDDLTSGALVQFKWIDGAHVIDVYPCVVAVEAPISALEISATLTKRVDELHVKRQHHALQSALWLNGGVAPLPPPPPLSTAGTGGGMEAIGRIHSTASDRSMMVQVGSGGGSGSGPVAPPDPPPP